jgi:hypothetical protein
VTDSTGNLRCSFAGGCSYEVTSSGLAGMIKADSEVNYISVCDEECVLSEDSDGSIAKCTLPKMSTVYSNENFGIETESEDLDSGKYFGTAEEIEIAFDGSLLTTPEDDSEECVLGMAFKEGHVGLLSQVKYFLPDMDVDEKALIVGNTQFQGSFE